MEYIVREFNVADKDAVIALFNRHCGNDIVYDRWDEPVFSDKFLNSPHFSKDCTFVATLNDEIIGFANGVHRDNIKVGFITMVIVDKKYRRHGIGTVLLENLENALKKYELKRIDCSFFNPINLTWNVPNTNKHQHNNAPGVEYPSAAHEFFLNQGYKAVAKENSYYLDLSQFVIPQEIKDRIEALNEKGITYEFFDKEKHDFKDLFDNLGSELWQEEITRNVYGDDPKPVLVPVYQNQAIGFAGPIYPQPNGRGYFTGIGVHSDFRTHGVGKALFFLLCKYELEFGAKYMTLFTGEENPARRMYEAAGFSIVHSWHIMRKEGL